MTDMRNRKLKRRALGGLCVAAAASAGLYALLKNDAEQDGWPPLGDRPLRLLSGKDDTVNGQRHRLIAEWNDLHPDFPAEMVELPAVADLQYSEIHAVLQAGDASVDVVNLDVPWIAEFASRGYLHRLEDVETGGFLERPLAAGRYKGGLYALPFNTDTGMLYYRKGDTDDALGTLSPADAADLTDWAALRERIASILAANQASDAPRFLGGIAMQLAPYEGFTVNVWEYLLANGIEADPDTGMIEFADPAATEALAMLATELRPDGELGLPYILRASLYHQEEESLKAFQDGATPFLRHWPRAYRVLSCAVDFEVGVVPMPGGVLGGQSLAVSAFSTRKEAAQGLVEFLTGEESQAALFGEGGFAATREAPYLDAAETTTDLSEEDCEQGSNLWPDVEALYAALAGRELGEEAGDAEVVSGARPTVERYTQFSRVFRDVLYPAIQEGPDPALGEFASRLALALEGK